MDKPLTHEQRKYYFGVVVEAQVDFYKQRKNWGAGVKYLLKAIGVGDDLQLTKDVIHWANKRVYNNANSISAQSDTTTVNMIEMGDGVRHDFYHDHNIDIPPPNTAPMEDYNAR